MTKLFSPILISTMVLFSPINLLAGDLDEAYELRISNLLNEYKFPGIAIAVVKDGRIVYEKGFGQRDIEQGLPVTPDTLFAIGSTTKAFTATAVGMMVDDGLLSFKTPVQNYLPDFELKDDVAGRLSTLTDLLCHRTGLARHDLMWYGRDISREDLLHRLRYLEPFGTFRDTFNYNNLMYMVAGVLVDRLGGLGSWENYVRDKILVQLSMDRTNFSIDELNQDDNIASPYTLKENELAKIEYRDLGAVAPAGSINSSVHEMASWLIFNLNHGSVDGRQLISKETHEQLVAPRLVLDNSLLKMVPEIKRSTYGLGWGQFFLRNREIIWHNGGIDGFIADVSFIPEEKLGVVVLANATHQMLPMMAAFMTYERL